MSPHVRSASARLTWIAVFAVVALSLLGGGYWNYRRETNEIRQDRYETITAIGQLKAGQIQQWRTERLVDATRMAKDRLLEQVIAEWLRDPGHQNRGADIRDRLGLGLTEGPYDNVMLLAPDGKILIAAGNAPYAVNPASERAVAAALSSREAVLSDFFREPDGIVHIDAVAAVRDAQGQPLAVALLRSNAESYLYPLIQSWPTPSHSAETFLVRREGGDVMYLNEPRHRSKTALILREPLTRASRPAVQAVLGRQGAFEGIDYRNVAVLADLRPIPGSPWFMVAKVDADEILAEARYRATVGRVIVGLFILLTGAATAYGYRQQQAGLLLRDLYESEHQERETQEAFRATLYSIGDAVITTDTEGRVREMNPTAERLTGWSKLEARGKPLEEVFRIFNEATRAAVVNPVTIALREGAAVGLADQTLLVARDGTEYVITESAAPIRDDSGAVSGVVLVFSDQTAAHAARRAVGESDRRYRALFDNMLNGYAYCRMQYDEHGRPVDFDYLAVNQAFERLTGLRDVVGKPVSEVVPGIRELSPELFEAYHRVASTGISETFEFDFKSRGQWLTISVHSQERGTFVAVFDDITERKLAEKALAERSRQQAAVALLGMRALGTGSWQDLMEETARVVAQTLGMEFCNVLELLPDRKTLLLRAGVGWKEGLVGHATVGAEFASQAGYTLKSRQPVVMPDVRAETRFSEPPLLHDHGVVSGMSVVIGDPEKPFGVLGVHTAQRRAFDQDDVNFLQAVANLLGEVVQRTRTNEELGLTAYRLSLATESALIGIWDLDLETNALIWDTRMYALYGIRPEDFSGAYDAWEKGVHPDDVATAAAEVKDAIAGAKGFHTEFRVVWPDGQVHDIEAHATVQRGPDGRPQRMIGVNWDISERRRAEEALREEKARYQMLFQQSPDGIVLIDAQTQLPVLFNDVAIRQLGYSHEEFARLRINDYEAAETPEVTKARIEKVLRTGRDDFETKHRTKTGDLRNVLVTVQVIDLSGQPVFHCIFRDITEHRHLEAQFLQAQKMETVGRLAGGIAHDFNNLLTIINGTAELASMGLRDEDPLCSEFREIRQAGERATSLTRQLLAFSRRQVMKSEVLNLSMLVAKLQNMLQRLLGEDITLVVVPAKEGGCVMADPVQIEQVVMNLVVNARDAMPDGGTLTVEIRDVWLDEAFAADHPSVQPGPHVMLAVSDTGVGMDEAVRARIFEPFFTTKEPGKGTGLGLSTVHGIVEQSQGSIWVDSERGRGTTFTIYLPRVEGVAHEFQAAPTVASAHGTETILLVEDERALRLVATRMLTSAGYTVLPAGTGEEALRVLEHHDGPVHLMLTDVVLPGIGGRELASRLAEIHPAIRVLYTSGHTDDVLLRRGVFDNIAHFIAKPYAIAGLTRKVREVLDS